jgi:hypothetical protein
MIYYNSIIEFCIVIDRESSFDFKLNPELNKRKIKVV